MAFTGSQTSEEKEDEQEDDDPGVSYSTRARGPDRDGMVNEYLPGREDWTAKTVLDLNDPGRVSVLRVMNLLFPMCAHHQPVIDEFLDTFLKARTSMRGASREEYQRIFESMYGGHPEDRKGRALMDLLSTPLDDE